MRFLKNGEARYTVLAMTDDRLAKYRAYLPSKKFLVVMGGGIVLLAIVFAVANRFGTEAGFDRNINPKAPVAATGTMGDIVTRDSNGNGIPDWEESLWGLDPSADGKTNKQIIEQKEAANGITPDTSGTAVTPTDQFSQSLLSTILALQQSGTLTEASVSNLAVSVANSIDAKHANPATYSIKDLTITATNKASDKATYEAAMKSLLGQYDSLDLGTELSTIADALDTGNTDELKQLGPVADAYGAISREIVKLPTPPGAAPYALAIANASAAMSASLPQVENIYNDVLTGMVGIDDYVNASNAEDSASAGMRSYFGL